MKFKQTLNEVMKRKASNVFTQPKQTDTGHIDAKSLSKLESGDVLEVTEKGHSENGKKFQIIFKGTLRPDSMIQILDLSTGKRWPARAENLPLYKIFKKNPLSKKK